MKHAATIIYMTAAIVLDEKSPYGPGTNDMGPLQCRERRLDLLNTYFGPQPRVAVPAGVAYHSYQPLWANGRVRANERHHPAREPAMNAPTEHLPGYLIVEFCA